MSSAWKLKLLWQPHTYINIKIYCSCKRIWNSTLLLSWAAVIEASIFSFQAPLVSGMPLMTAKLWAYKLFALKIPCICILNYLHYRTPYLCKVWNYFVPYNYWFEYWVFFSKINTIKVWGKNLQYSIIVHHTWSHMVISSSLQSHRHNHNTIWWQNQSCVTCTPI